MLQFMKKQVFPKKVSNKKAFSNVLQFLTSGYYKIVTPSKSKSRSNSISSNTGSSNSIILVVVIVMVVVR